MVLVFAWFFSDHLIFYPPPQRYSWNDGLITIASPDAGNTGSKHPIVARYLINPEARYTVLYSHGNATDISQLILLQQQFYHHGFSVIVYDYSGYGLSAGTASEPQLYNDVQAVYQYLLDNTSLKAENIIAYGHSLGAAVATELAYRNPVAALVVESPFVSAFRVTTVLPVLPFDKFSSIDKIKQVDTPLLVLHSRDDPVIAYWHSEALFAKAVPPKQYFGFADAGHSGISDKPLFWQKLASFISMMK